MDIVRISSRRAGALFAAGLLLFATMLPALASAATITSRSIALSSSVVDATNVTYEVSFVAKTASTDSFIVDFCTTAAINTACTGPSGLTSASVGTTGDTATSLDANTVQVDLATPAGNGTTVTVDLTGMVNPDTATEGSPYYARIVTYDDATDAGFYASDDIDNSGSNTHFDSGTVALAFTDGFDVSGSVSETLTFCASGAAITQSDCSDAVDANIELGTGGVLDSGSFDTGTVYTQISTNAVGGATVSLKSDATGCGGLMRDGGSGDDDGGCGIAPLTVAGTINAGQSLFGLTLANLGGASSTSTAVEAPYTTTDYVMGYVDGDASGVTGPYGDVVYNTGGDPVEDGTANLTFGASISALTPAGQYRASMNLIATGTF